jgi:hypothetical protein
MDQATGPQKAANIDTGLSSERVVGLPKLKEEAFN